MDPTRVTDSPSDAPPQRVVYHLASVSELEAHAGRAYHPEGFHEIGFVHCCGDEATLLEIANHFYRHRSEDFVVLDLDVDALGPTLVWEAAQHPNGRPTRSDEPLFPHVYSPLEAHVIRRVRSLRRTSSGEFTAIMSRESQRPAPLGDD